MKTLFGLRPVDKTKLIIICTLDIKTRECLFQDSD